MAAVRLVALLLALLLPAAAGGIPLRLGARKRRPAAVAAAKPPDGEVPPPPPPPPPFVKRGWLMKKGRRRRRSWKRRYFVLSDDWSSVSYFEDERCATERGRVRLEGARCDAGLDYVPKKRGAHAFAFTVRAGDDRVYHLECSSEGERRRWLRTLRTAATSARDEAKAEVEEERRAARRAEEAREEEREAPASLRASSVDGLVGDAGLFHREGWLRALNENLASERTLAQVNEALRGIYVVEAMTLRYAGDDRIAVKRFELRPDVGEHRLGLDVRWPQRLTCHVRGHRPAGGGLPPFLRTAAHHLKMDLSVKHPLSFQLRSRLCGRPRCELVLRPSPTAPFPQVTRVELTRLPRVALDRNDALRLKLDGADAAQSLLGALFGLVPREVLVGLLERQLNDALEDPRTAAACRWDLPDPPGAAREDTPFAGRLARAAESSWKGVAVEFPAAAAQVERSAGWFGREVGKRAVAAWGAFRAAAPGPHSLLMAKEEKKEEKKEEEKPRWFLRAKQEEQAMHEWQTSKTASILDVKPLNESDRAVANTDDVTEKSNDAAHAVTDGKGWRPSILDAGLLEDSDNAVPNADAAPEKSVDTAIENEGLRLGPKE